MFQNLFKFQNIEKNNDNSTEIAEESKDDSLDEYGEGNGSDTTMTILNPKTVLPEEQVFFGPLNKVCVDGQMMWVCDFCQKTMLKRCSILIHIKNHFMANGFYLLSLLILELC